MSRVFFKVAFAFLVSLFGWSVAQAQNTLQEIKKRGELLVGIEPGFFPFEMRKPNGEWVGFDVDIANSFAKELGVKVKFIDTAFDGIIPSLLAKKFDVIMSGMTITDERSKAVLFTQPYYKAGLAVLLATKNNGKVKGAAELNKKEFVVAIKTGTTGDVYAAKSLKDAQLKKFDSDTDAANAVALGKVDAFIYDQPFQAIFAKRNSGKVTLLPGLLSEEQLGLAARKGDTGLVEAFNAWLKKAKESGAYDAMYKTHFVEMPWLKDFPDAK